MTEEKRLECRERFLSLSRNQIHRDGVEKLLLWTEKSDFFIAPASTRYHGNYPGGLVEHSLNVYDCLTSLAARYPSFGITEDSVTLCALFHDVCKANFYKPSQRNVKDEKTGMWVKRDCYEIDEQFPIGHGEKSCIILQWFLPGELTTDELLAIRYHMGGWDSAARGGDSSINRAYDMCPLAPMLQLADAEATYMLERTKQ